MWHKLRFFFHKLLLSLFREIILEGFESGESHRLIEELANHLTGTFQVYILHLTPELPLDFIAIW